MIPELLGPAIDFYRAPRRFERFTDATNPLPAGVTELLAAPFHALSEEQLEETAERLGATPEECRAAVPFFIKQAMLEPDGDHYRALGVPRNAERSLIRQHYHYLMKLFHPDNDVDDSGWDDLYAPRINEAYNTLKDPKRRAEYDSGLRSADEGFSPRAVEQRERAGRPRPPPPSPGRSGGMSPGAWKVTAGLSVGAVVLILVLIGVQSNQPELRLGAGGARNGPELPEPGAASESPADTRRVSDAGPDNDSAPPSTQGADEDIPVAPAASYGGTTLESDRRVEEMVKARVAQATQAVLGPQAANRPPARTSDEPVTEPASRAPEGIPTVQAPDRPVESSGAASDAGSAGAEEGVSVEAVTASVTTETPRASAPMSGEEHDTSAPAISSVAITTDNVADPVSESPPQPVPTLAAVGDVPVENSAITTLELGQLLDRFVESYEAGDARAFADLFSPNARTTDANGRKDIHDTYAEFFARPERRTLELQRFKWNRVTDIVGAGEGLASISTQPLDGGRAQRGNLEIDLVVERLDDGLRITRLFYESR